MVGGCLEVQSEESEESENDEHKYYYHYDAQSSQSSPSVRQLAKEGQVYRLAFLTLSAAFPWASWALPTACSTLPLTRSFLLSVILPTSSRTLPLICLPFPFISSWFMYPLTSSLY